MLSRNKDITRSVRSALPQLPLIALRTFAHKVLLRDECCERPEQVVSVTSRDTNDAILITHIRYQPEHARVQSKMLHSMQTRHALACSLAGKSSYCIIAWNLPLFLEKNKFAVFLRKYVEWCREKYIMFLNSQFSNNFLFFYNKFINMLNRLIAMRNYRIGTLFICLPFNIFQNFIFFFINKAFKADHVTWKFVDQGLLKVYSLL